MKLPLIKDLRALVIDLKGQIMDDYRAEGCEDLSYPTMDLTVGANEEGEWNYQTGDNSFTGGAYSYPHWAVTTIDRRSNATEVAREIREQLADLMSQ